MPGWAEQIDDATLVVVDEAGMAGTTELADVIDFVIERGGSVQLIGDNRQLAAVGAGGVLRDVQAAAGAATLAELMRFVYPAEAAATLAVRDGDATAVGFYLDTDASTTPVTPRKRSSTPGQPMSLPAGPR